MPRVNARLGIPGTLPTEGQSYDPNRALWAAVLEGWWADRWTTTSTYTGARRRDREGDEAWLRSDEGSVGSFAWICELFDCDPGMLRRALLTPPKRQGRRAIP